MQVHCIIPSKVFIWFVSSDAFNGAYDKNPFNYRDFDIRTAGFYVDGLSLPNQPLEMNFTHRDIISAYGALVETAGKSDSSTHFDINTKRFGDGFTILAFNLESTAVDTLDYWAKPRVAHARLELRFGTPLPEPINVIMLGVIPQILYIDKSRNVSTGTHL